MRQVGEDERGRPQERLAGPAIGQQGLVSNGRQVLTVIMGNAPQHMAVTEVHPLSSLRISIDSRAFICNSSDVHVIGYGNGRLEEAVTPASLKTLENPSPSDGKNSVDGDILRVS